MEFRVSGDWRERQTRAYATYAGNPLYVTRDKTDFEHIFTDHSLLHTLEHMENPLQKNLGDPNIGSRLDKVSKVSQHENITRIEIPKPRSPAESGWRAEIFPTFFGITSLITGFFSNIAGVATLQQTRPAEEQKPPETYTPSAPRDIRQRDRGSADRASDDSPPIDDATHFSRRDCSKNNVEASANTVGSWLAQCEARGDVAEAAARGAMPLPSLADPAQTCRTKMARIQDLLAGKAAEMPRAKPFKRYRPKKIFIDPKFVQEKAVEPFVPEPLGRLESVDTTNFVNPGLITPPLLPQVETLPRVKLELESQTPAGVNGDGRVVNGVTNATEHLNVLNCDQPKAVVETKSAKDEEKDITRIAVDSAVAESSNALNKHSLSDETKVTREKACDLRTACGVSSTPESVPDCKRVLISTCEDKLSRLKALLSERKKNRVSQEVTETSAVDSKLKSVETVTVASRERSETAPSANRIDSIAELAESAKSQSVCQTQSEDIAAIDKPQNRGEHVSKTNNLAHKHETGPEKNPNETCIALKSDVCSPRPEGLLSRPSKHRSDPNRLDVRTKRKQLRQHGDDNESDLSSSVESSPKITLTPPGNGFDEIRGRFESSSSSDDSFVIVFSDSPAASPPCTPRDRTHSDTSDDSFIVFDEGAKCFTVDDSESDSDGECDSDECESNLASAGRFSRTVADLTDERLYDVDGWRVGDSDSDEDEKPGGRGVLLTEEKKRARAGRPEKRVRFSEKSPEVHVMRVWAFAARQARVGNWRQHAADAERFKRRIADVDMAISWVLKPQHRNRVKFQRFMPWWHQQRRLEAAERRAQEERRKAEEERRKMEELERIEEERRIEEEVKAELALERKNRKKVTSYQFAKNMSLYLAKTKPPPQQSQQHHQQQRKHNYQQQTDGEHHTVNGVNESVEEEITSNTNSAQLSVAYASEANGDTNDALNKNVFSVNINENVTDVSGENVEGNEKGDVETDVLNENMSDLIKMKNGTDVNVLNENKCDVNGLENNVSDVSILDREIFDVNLPNKSISDARVNGLTETNRVIQKLHS